MSTSYKHRRLARVTAIAFLILAIALGRAVGWEEPNPKDLDSMYACQSPNTGPGLCVASWESCYEPLECSMRSGECVFFQPPNPCGGTCTWTKVVDNQPWGVCNAGYSGSCTKCAYLVCSEGKGYTSQNNCLNNINPCTPMWQWQADACDPP